MGFLEDRKESYERYKIRRLHFWLLFLGVIVAVYSAMAFLAPPGKLDFANLFIYDFYSQPYYSIPIFAIFVAALFYWRGNLFNRLLDKLGLYRFADEYVYKWFRLALEAILPGGIYKAIDKSLFGKTSRFDELDAFFYQAPVKDDAVPKIPYGKFKLFKDDADPYTIFDFSEKSVGEKDEEGTNRIIALFRGKDFNEKSERYVDLFSVIEGKLDATFGGEVKRVSLKSPVAPVIDHEGRIKKFDVDLSRDVYDPKNDKIVISPSGIKETMVYLTYAFDRWIEASLKKGTKIRRLYGDELKKPEVRRKVVDFFKFFLFRRLISNYGSIPSGMVVIRAEDYDFRRVASTIDRPLVISIGDSNVGAGDSNDDRFASMFLFLWHAFFTKSVLRNVLSDVLWCYDPLKGLTDVKLKRQVEMAESKAMEEASSQGGEK